MASSIADPLSHSAVTADWLNVLAMTAPILAAATFCIVTTVIHVGEHRDRGAFVCDSAAAAAGPRSGQPFPPVSLVRPLCGIDNYAAETLRSTFALDYPAYEILFCVAAANDPVVPLVESLIAAHPGRRREDPDRRRPDQQQSEAQQRAQRLATRPGMTGSCSPIQCADAAGLSAERLSAAGAPIPGWSPRRPSVRGREGIWAELECAFLNTYQARWQYVADALGFGFAQGKTMLWRRADLERAGGIEALAQGSRRRRRRDQDRARLRPQGPAGRPPVCAAARLSQRRRSLEPATALGAAAPCKLPAFFLPEVCPADCCR